ncbi:Ribonuclease P protein subunit p40 [Chionoecetes opilio]|uniref:Ribonuclease P protein subunit p40 n=1 Tax=Chionoecetes opilio TaxID=41210 RepID=A0A8J4XVD8_CHIOP|nr:Ribonuclease P protein subunit p40 [Chionoecetes opilio]
MHNPEVIKFPAPECRLSYGCYRWDEAEKGTDKADKGKSWHWLVNQHPFNTKVSLLMPDSPTIPRPLRELLTEDTEFYRVDKLPLHELCAPAFLQAFLNTGQLFALSCDTRLDLDNSCALTPDGLLRLLLDKLTYQELALSGDLSAHILRTPPERFVVEVDLKNTNFHPGKPHYRRVTSALTRLPLAFSLWLLWLPQDPGICPSSIAKYFHDLGYDIKECGATVGQGVVGEALMPHPGPPLPEEEAGEDLVAEPEDLLEWVGCQMLGIKLSREESVLSGVVEPRQGMRVANLCCAQCSGFFPPSHILLLIDHLRLWLAQRDVTAVPWVGVTVYGHPDSPVSWGRQEHSHHTTGDNLYTLVLTREHLLAYQLQGPSKPQRLYVKTNKNK